MPYGHMGPASASAPHVSPLPPPSPLLCPPFSRDAFIASTGCVPGDSATLQENALALARLAVEMQRLCATLTAPDGSPVVMRIGLHCGPVVGGVVGGNMIRYHLFGSTMDAVSQVRLGGGGTGGQAREARLRACCRLPLCSEGRATGESDLSRGTCR